MRVYLFYTAYFFISKYCRILLINSAFLVMCCIIKYKDTILKAIHNCDYVGIVSGNSCIIKYKDTILKAIHNTKKAWQINLTAV